MWCGRTVALAPRQDTEFPGVVARPIGQFTGNADYHYQTLRCNCDLLKIIQLVRVAIRCAPACSFAPNVRTPRNGSLTCIVK